MMFECLNFDIDKVMLWHWCYGCIKMRDIFTFRGYFVFLDSENANMDMEDKKVAGIVFIDNVGDYDIFAHSGSVMHILCVSGSVSFTFQEIRYNVAVGDYVILPNMSLASGFTESADFHAIIMCLSESFVTSLAIRSNYGIIGHLSLLHNPVMKLSERDFRKCREDMLRLRERLSDTAHLFREEMIGHLLMAHILDLYDIHARGQNFRQVPERAQQILRAFIEMLYNGEYIHNRNLSHYASALCITPHYLTEICKNVSGRPASYWIDRFTILEIARLLRRKELPLMEVADRLNFSSLSYFTRYVRKRFGMTPSAYRDGYGGD